MADESPDQIRQRILSEELAKGSDPRVAEGRAKAAEMRARHGLPIDPEQAWRAKQQQEGGAAPATEAAEEPAPKAAEAPREAPAEETPAEQPAAAETPAEQPAAAARLQAPIPSGVEVQRESAEIVPAVSPPIVAPSQEIQFEPEIGEIVELDTEEMAEVAGIKLADAKLPGWLVAVFVALVSAAVVYLLVFSGPGVAEEASGCRVDANRAIVCSSTDTAPATSEEAAR